MSQDERREGHQPPSFLRLAQRSHRDLSPTRTTLSPDPIEMSLALVALDTLNSLNWDEPDSYVGQLGSLPEATSELKVLGDAADEGVEERKEVKDSNHESWKEGDLREPKFKGKS